MKNFGETLRELRTAQNLGLRETALQVDISPAYLSRIERGKESPPSPSIIQSLARILAADPDVLFRLAATTDPGITEFLVASPKTTVLLREIMDAGLGERQIDEVTKFVKNMKSA
jgi:transcriptional regulator with XRE-family HTH domain